MGSYLKINEQQQSQSWQKEIDMSEETTNLAKEAKGLMDELRLQIASLEDEVKRLKKLTITDEGTGIYNRRYFEEEFPKKILDSFRRKEHLALVMVDIDYFKKYNDHYGHQKGDTILKAVAQAIRKSLHRPGDIVARYGGEEFIIILTDTNRFGAKVVAETVREAVEKLGIEHKNSEVSEVITVSMGVAIRPPNYEYSDRMLLKEADDNLYTAKENGRNQIYL